MFVFVISNRSFKYISRGTWKRKLYRTSDITKVCNKDDDGGDNVGAMFQEEIVRFSNVGMNLEREKN